MDWDLRLLTCSAYFYSPDLQVARAQWAVTKAGIITAGGALKLDRLVVASTYNDGDVRYLVGSLYDVRRGSLLREGKLRLAGWRARRLRSR